MKHMLIILIILCMMFMEMVAGELKKSKLEEILLKRDKGVMESEIHKNAWVDSLILEGRKHKMNHNDVDSFTINRIDATWSQDIYRSGGIRYERALSDIEKRIKIKAIDIEIKQLNMDIYEHVIFLRMIDLKLSQFDLYMANKKIETRAKRDKYKQGLVDISEVDNAMLELTELKNQKNKVKKEKISLAKGLKVLSNNPYEKIKLPTLSFPALEVFIEKNSIHALKDEARYANINKKLQGSKYLPKVTTFANYNYQDNDFIFDRLNTNDKSSFSFGVSISMEIGINSKRENELAQIEYLMSEKKYTNSIDDEKIFYKNILDNIKLIKQRIGTYHEEIKSYNTLFLYAKDMVLNGLSTKDDLVVLKNIKNIKLKDIQIAKLNKKLFIVRLYKHTK